MADLKELRIKMGLTQSELAEKVGVSENTIQNWENGKTMPKGDNLNQYLSALGIKDQAEMKRIVGEMPALSCISSGFRVSAMQETETFTSICAVTNLNCHSGRAARKRPSR